MIERFGNIPQAEIMDKILETYAANPPLDVQLAPGRFRYNWYSMFSAEFVSIDHFLYIGGLEQNSNHSRALCSEG